MTETTQRLHPACVCWREDVTHADRYAGPVHRCAKCSRVVPGEDCNICQERATMPRRAILEDSDHD